MHLNTGRILTSAILLTSTFASAQNIDKSNLAGQLNTVTTSVPFLIISPDARAGGMGDMGVATTPDVNSIHWNVAKLAFIKANMGVGLSYTPWLRQLVPDISLSYVSFHKKIDDIQTFGASLRYFSLGNITFTNLNGEQIGNFSPNEFALDGAYARKLSDNLSVGVALRYIYSNLAAGLDQNNQTRPGNAAAGDLGFYYQKPITIKQKDVDLSAGLALTNMGGKIAYTQSGQANFIPTNMRLGTQLKFKLDEFNSFAISIEANKLLVPTNPVYLRDSTGKIVIDANQNPVIAFGEDPNSKSTIKGMLNSFSDAPGGFKEEIKEINYQIGAEYWYDNQFALRAGYFHESPSKGARQYFTMGAGLKYNVFQLNFSYLIPVNQVQRSPLENTLRFTLAFDMDALSSNKGK